MSARPEPGLTAKSYGWATVKGMLSPAARVLSALILSVGLALLPHVGGAVGVAIAGLVIACTLLCRPNLKRLSVRLSLALGVIVGLVAPFLLSGDIDNATRLGLRALGAATIALLFTSDLSSSALAGALRTLWAPVAFVEVLEGLALQLDSLRNLAGRIVLARRLRGASGLRDSVTILPELLVRSAERAERLDLARRLRGYDVKRRARMTALDLLAPLLSASAALSLHVLTQFS